VSDSYSVLGGRERAARPDGWHTDEHGTRWALYGVYVTTKGKMAQSTFSSSLTVGVVFSDASPMGPKQRRRFTRFAPKVRWWPVVPARVFAVSMPFGHPRELIAAAEAAGVPFRRSRVCWGPGIGR